MLAQLGFFSGTPPYECRFLWSLWFVLFSSKIALRLTHPQSSLFGSDTENETREAWTIEARRVLGRTALLSLIDGKTCVTSVKIILFEKTFGQTSPLFKQIFFVKHQKTLMLIEDFNKKRKYNPVTFFPPNRLPGVLFFLPSCCVNLLILLGDWETARSESGSKEGNREITQF